jgi:methylamine dehydrogenase light chain
MHDDKHGVLNGLDARMARGARRLASGLSRRGALARLGAALVGMGGVPLLPFVREAEAQTEHIPEMGDPRSCDYWRYCAFGGYLCSCCGGSHTQCPPGTELSPVTWIGTCTNPTDGKQYVISYNDCCGKSVCGRCGCHRTEGDRPVYFPSKSNDILWCFGTKSHSYHCTVALVLSSADNA